MASRSNSRFRLATGLIALCLVLAGTAATAENLTVTFDAAPYRIVDAGSGQHLIEMDGFNSSLTPGKPMLPAKSFVVALPGGATVNSVSWVAHGTVDIDGHYSIKPVNANLPTDDDAAFIDRLRRQWQDNYSATYNSDAAYPQENGIYAGTGGLRKYTYATLIFCPFTYHPVSGRLQYTPSVTATIDYTPGPVHSPDMEKRLRDTKADRQAAELFVNFEQARPWYEPTAAPTGTQAITNYLVIHSDQIEDYADDFCENYFVCADMHWVAGHLIDETYTGIDFAEKIRNYLIDKFAEWNFDYLLIIGDINEIPMRQTFPVPDYHYPTSPYCPYSDYYYADLTGDWDSDGDGYFGEYGQDNVDFTPEIHVGRIPFNDSANVARILGNIHDFNYDQGDWKNDALMMGAMICFENEDDSGYARTDGADLMESMKTGVFDGLTLTTMYEAAGLDPCYHEMDYPLSHTEVINQWAPSDPGIVVWLAHGNEYGSSRKWWDFDDGDNIPEAGEMGWEQFIGTSDAPSLSSDNKPICFGSSCLISRPTAANLGKSLLNNDASAAVIAPMGISMVSTGWDEPSDGGAASFTWYYFDYMLNNDQRLGQALTSTRIQYASNFLFWSGWSAALNLYDFCLYGDPRTLYAGDPVSCCVIRGDVDHNGTFDVLDVLYLVDYFWSGGDPPPCLEEADVNADDQVDTLDLLYLVAHMWQGGDPPVPCP
ncbi:MAG: hypothetical protein JSW34_05920 [Candidatus Zixiibacteriota bacterium]|nr:MAG: hypothetical protein JSW34_05920 [candidate division Zixibacteria bacterium]